MTKVSFYSTVKSTQGVVRELEDILSEIKTGYYKEKILEVRNPMLTEAGQKKRKSQLLEAHTTSGVFNGGHSADNFQEGSHTGLVQIDFDDLTDARREELFEKLTKDKKIKTLYRSPRNGLKALAKVDPIPADAWDHECAVEQLYADIAKTYGEKPDPNCRDISRLCFVSYDPDLFIRTDKTTKPFNWFKVERILEPSLEEFEEMHPDADPSVSDHGCRFLTHKFLYSLETVRKGNRDNSLLAAASICQRLHLARRLDIVWAKKIALNLCEKNGYIEEKGRPRFELTWSQGIRYGNANGPLQKPKSKSTSAVYSAMLADNALERWARNIVAVKNQSKKDDDKHPSFRLGFRDTFGTINFNYDLWATLRMQMLEEMLGSDEKALTRLDDPNADKMIRYMVIKIGDAYEKDRANDRDLPEWFEKITLIEEPELDRERRYLRFPNYIWDLQEMRPLTTEETMQQYISSWIRPIPDDYDPKILGHPHEKMWNIINHVPEEFWMEVAYSLVRIGRRVVFRKTATKGGKTATDNGLILSFGGDYIKPAPEDILSGRKGGRGGTDEASTVLHKPTRMVLSEEINKENFSMERAKRLSGGAKTESGRGIFKPQGEHLIWATIFVSFNKIPKSMDLRSDSAFADRARFIHLAAVKEPDQTYNEICDDGTNPDKTDAKRARQTLVAYIFSLVDKHKMFDPDYTLEKTPAMIELTEEYSTQHDQPWQKNLKNSLEPSTVKKEWVRTTDVKAAVNEIEPSVDWDDIVHTLESYFPNDYLGVVKDVSREDRTPRHGGLKQKEKEA